LLSSDSRENSKTSTILLPPLPPHGSLGTRKAYQAVFIDMLLTRIVLLSYLMRWYLPGTHAMVMFSSDANVCCCFRRLGIERGSTERQIKQAFRQLARGSHPDMFTEPTDKERATVAFRELYKTYQEALRAESSGSAAPDQNRNARRTTDSYIRKAFQDTCDEEDRSLDAWRRERWSRQTRSVQEAWPDRDLTWKIVSTGEGWLLSFEIDELASFFEGGSYANISRFLREKVAQQRLEAHNRWELEYDEWARYIEDHWPDADADQTLLKEWAETTWMLIIMKKWRTESASRFPWRLRPF
jgi:YD repeat-containing protein